MASAYERWRARKGVATSTPARYVRSAAPPPSVASKDPDYVEGTSFSFKIPGLEAARTIKNTLNAVAKDVATDITEHPEEMERLEKNLFYKSAREHRQRVKFGKWYNAWSTFHEGEKWLQRTLYGLDTDLHPDYQLEDTSKILVYTGSSLAGIAAAAYGSPEGGVGAAAMRGVNTTTNLRNNEDFATAARLAAKYGPDMYKRMRGLPIRGSGAYSVAVNELINNPRPPAAITVSNSEYIGQIATDQTWSLQRAAVLNPGNGALWPWLNSLTCNYDMWRPIQIIFEFKPTMSENASTSSLGTVQMCVDYDQYDDPPDSKTDMVRMAGSVEAMPTKSMLMGVECDARYNQLGRFYILPNGQAIQGSKREYNLGTFYCATSGYSDGDTQVICGDIWVHYTIELCKAQSVRYLNLDRWSATTGVDATSPWGVTATNTHIDSGYDSTLTSATTVGTYTFPTTVQPGELYLIVCWWVGGAAACARGTVAYSSKCREPTIDGSLSPAAWANYFIGDEVSFPEIATAAGTNITRFQVSIAVEILAGYYDPYPTATDGGTAPSVTIGTTADMVLPTSVTNFGFTCILVGKNP